MASPSVLVLGAGISGFACARALQEAGVDVRVADRGHQPAGRMSSRTLHGRPVDLGASYFTAESGSPFETLVRSWLDRGIAREWTDTFSSAGPDGLGDAKPGPMRYASPTGSRELVIDLGRGLYAEQERTVERVTAELEADGIRYDTIVLAMPDPQAKRVLAPDASAYGRLQGVDSWEPTIAVAMGWGERHWPAALHGAFVNGSADVSFIADDGDRRGDDAPVLVAHSTAELAQRNLDDPDAVIPSIVEAVTTTLGIEAAPSWSYAYRWTFARPAQMHDAPFLLSDGIGLCGDAWGTKSSVATAWTSGDALGREIATRLAG